MSSEGGGGGDVVGEVGGGGREPVPPVETHEGAPSGGTGVGPVVGILAQTVAGLQVGVKLLVPVLYVRVARVRACACTFAFCARVCVCTVCVHVCSAYVLYICALWRGS